jgi:hypothetical protein
MRSGVASLEGIAVVPDTAPPPPAAGFASPASVVLAVHPVATATTRNIASFAGRIVCLLADSLSV